MVIKQRKAEEIGIGAFVYHERFGTGRVVDRWGPLVIRRDGKSKAVLAQCEDVFDVIFGKALHSCRKEFLRPVMTGLEPSRYSTRIGQERGPGRE